MAALRTRSCMFAEMYIAIADHSELQPSHAKKTVILDRVYFLQKKTSVFFNSFLSFFFFLIWHKY